MKKILLFAAALCGLTSFAVEPVAVWNGDLADGSVKGSFTMSKSAASVTFADGSATLTSVTSGSAPTGVVVSFPNAGSDITVAGKMTVFVKYSGFSASTSNNSLISLVCPNANNEVVAYLNGGTKAGLAYSVTTSSAGTQGVSSTAITFPTEGIMMLSIANDGATSDTTLRGTRFAVAAKNTDGTYGDFILGQYTPGIKWGSGQNITEIKVGGTIAQIGHYHRPAMKVEGVSVYVEATSIATANTMKNDIFAIPEPEEPKVEPLMLVNFRNGTATGVQTSAVDGWTDETRHGEATIPNGGTLSVNGISFATSGGSGKLWSNNWRTPTADYAEGTYNDVFGTVHENLIEEIKTSLCSPDLILDANVYKTGFLNGGSAGQTATISGLTVNQKYLVYVGFGLKKGDSDGTDQTHTFKIESSGYSTADSLQYVKVGASDDATSYSDYTVGSVLIASVNGLMLVRMNGITPNSSGNIVFTMPSGRSGLNFLAVAKVNEVKSDSTVIDVAGDVDYSTLETDGFKKITLNLTADATVMFSEAVSAALTFTGSHNLTVKGAEKLNFDSVNAAGVTGDKTFEFNASGYTAGANLKSLIKTGGDKYTFVFVGSANAGVTVDYGDTNITENGPIFTSHVVFDGGAHTLKERHENQTANFGSNATAAKPTFLVRNGATLTYQARNPSGWGPGAANANGIIRVNDGCTLNLQQIQGTLYWNQQFYIEPGATLNHSEGAGVGNNQYNIRILGGANQNACQIYVPDSEVGNQKVATFSTTRVLEAKSEGNNKGLGIFVGANSRLKISGAISGSEQIRKYGTGTLEVVGTVSASNFAVETGALVGGTYSAGLTLAAGTSLDLSATATVSGGTLTLPKPINLVCEPVHGMTVITPPSGFAGTGYKATLNGSEQQYDLYLEDGALKLKYKTPPEFTEELGTITAIVADGKGGTVEVDISKLNLGDYSDSVSYSLKFGEVVVDNPEFKEGKVSFSLNPETFKPNTVYRGEFIVDFGDGTISNEINVYQGERQFVMMDKAVVIKEATTINNAEGCTINPVYENSDYIDTCDSIYSVTLSASEAVEASADPALNGDEQGGLRLVKVNDTTVKLEYVYNDENDNNTLKWGDQWPNGTELETVALGLNASITVQVEFHYSKGGEEDISYVKYSIGENYEKSVTSWATAKKISEIFISDGTILGTDKLAGILGQFQLDKAVIVDVEVEIGHGDTQEITAADEKAAQEIADKMVIAIASEIAEKLTNEQQEAYRGYFKVQVTESGEGKFSAAVVFKADVEKAIEEDLEKAMDKVVSGFESGSAEIAAKPGLYYGVKRGDSPGNMNTIETELATSDKVTIKISKPEGASAHFYRIIVSPTPSETK